MTNEENFVPTPEQVEAALADPETPEELTDLTDEEKVIGARILPRVVAKVKAQADAEAAKSLAAKTQELIAQNQRMMQEEVERFRNQLQPPDPKQLEELLSQEYAEMEVPVMNGRKREQRMFVLRELPQEAEKRLFAIVQKRILPHLKELATVEWTASATTGAKVQKVLDIIPDGLDMLAECCAICLDPWGDEEITVDYVQKNLGSNRIMHIVEAQMEISKIRDFGSAVYRLLPR